MKILHIALRVIFDVTENETIETCHLSIGKIFSIRISTPVSARAMPITRTKKIDMRKIERII